MINTPEASLVDTPALLNIKSGISINGMRRHYLIHR
jgi:hypothetical protein